MDATTGALARRRRTRGMVPRGSGRVRWSAWRISTSSTWRGNPSRAGSPATRRAASAPARNPSRRRLEVLGEGRCQPPLGTHRGRLLLARRWSDAKVEAAACSVVRLRGVICSATIRMALAHIPCCVLTCHTPGTTFRYAATRRLYALDHLAPPPARAALSRAIYF